ncbi:MAG: ferrochelatase [Azospirillaceae bacterium]|nr:ferrochelatase [Azospirillaceae bacterium]
MVETSAPRKTAIVLFNLGGPDCPDAVRPFLFNLFADPAIIALPGLLRLFVAYAIARRRHKTAQVIYEQIGGRSPLLPNTEAQAAALKAALSDLEPLQIFIAMRYWHPMSDEVAQAVKAYAPDRILLLPLYPQWSQTTTASSLKAWHRAARIAGLDVPTRALCCYPTDTGFIQAAVALIEPALAEAERHGRPRLLLSAHGLPKRVVAAGDPYQWQCQQTCQAIIAALNRPDLDWVGCYQSRVGPLKWIEPAADAEIDRAARDRVPVVMAPIAFVSEHSETLVEIAIEYRHRAESQGVPYFASVPAVGTHPDFILGLSRLVRRRLASDRGDGLDSDAGGRTCPSGFCGCALAATDGSGATATRQEGV